ncbi:MAG: Calx-beta domain-containing protein, partial [Vicinamibacterales bacterium]
MTAPTVSASYAYDPAGLRLARTVNGVTTYTVRSAGGEILSEYLAACGTPIWVKDTIYAGGRPLGAITPLISQPTVGVTAPTATVGEAAGSASVSVALTVPGGGSLGCPITVAYQTTDGTARSGADFTTKEGVVTFPAGSAHGATQAIPVSITNDLTDEDDQTFHVDLTSATGGGVSATAGRTTVTITDDDAPPTLTFATASAIAEGHSGTSSAAVTLELSAVSERAIQVSYATANGTATAGADYTSASGTMTIPPGALTGDLVVGILGDTVVEPWESFMVTLSAPVAATLPSSSGARDIKDDDA